MGLSRILQTAAQNDRRRMEQGLPIDLKHMFIGFLAIASLCGGGIIVFDQGAPILNNIFEAGGILDALPSQN